MYGRLLPQAIILSVLWTIQSLLAAFNFYHTYTRPIQVFQTPQPLNVTYRHTFTVVVATVSFLGVAAATTFLGFLWARGGFWLPHLSGTIIVWCMIGEVNLREYVSVRYQDQIINESIGGTDGWELESRPKIVRPSSSCLGTDWDFFLIGNWAFCHCQLSA
ncbi:hypothetical protein F5Y02DRAFT_423856 [Annulohypoxylon stygium]|nr:hypothetical protein F5Y02DRAFT_423856 [Annulohypoxylon stygium]